jgi:hypothetical protein
MTHRHGVHACAALALVTTLKCFHLAILLDKHRLSVWSPTHAHTRAYTYTYTYVRWHAPNGTCGRHALPLPLTENEDGWFVVLAQRVLSNWLGL